MKGQRETAPGKIRRNSARCLKCGQDIESKYTHDFVTCRCGNLSVDGGLSYMKRSVRDGDASWKDTSITELYH